MVRGMDEGLPVAYTMLDTGVAVFASGGEQVGTVGSVLCEPHEDVFHGLLVNVPSHGVRFLEAASIASIHERGVDLRIDADAAQQLPPPEHAAPVYDEDPGDQSKWHHWVHKLSGHGDWKHED
jgi:hypothetical protein